MEKTAKKNPLLKSYRRNQLLITLLPAAALVLLLGIFIGVVTHLGYRLDIYLRIIFNEGVVLAVVATGAIFI